MPAAPELDIGGDGVALREVGGELFADAPHALGRPKQANRQIEQMDACSRHPARRRLVRLQAPVVAIERQELVMTEVGLDLVNAPQFSGVGFRQQLRDRGLPPALVTHPENEPRVATQANGLFGAGLVQGQRLLAKHVLPRPDCGLDLFAMQRVRRRQNDGFDLGIGERIRVIGRQGDALLVAERARRLELARRREPRGCRLAQRPER